MRFMPLLKYDENTMQLAAPIIDKKRRVLLGSGQVIHPTYQRRLLDMGIRMVIVEDVVSKGITLEDMLEMPTWMEAIESVQTIFETAKIQKPLPIPIIQKLATSLASEVKRRKTILLVPSNSIAQDLKLYAHSVNVALLALQTAKRLSYNDFQLRDLAIGCLLHDIGRVQTEQENEIPEAGFEILRKNRELSLLSAHVAYQQGERWDGTGFPRKIQGEKFLDFAQICGICNAYENLLIEEMAPHLAMEKIMTFSGTAFSTNIVDAFIRSVPSYPPGTKVFLTTGEEGIVTRINTHLHRPVVRLLHTEKEIALEDHPTILIEAVGE